MKKVLLTLSTAALLALPTAAFASDSTTAPETSSSTTTTTTPAPAPIAPQNFVKPKQDPCAEC